MHTWINDRRRSGLERRLQSIENNFAIDVWSTKSTKVTGEAGQNRLGEGAIECGNGFIAPN